MISKKKNFAAGSMVVFAIATALTMAFASSSCIGTRVVTSTSETTGTGTSTGTGSGTSTSTSTSSGTSTSTSSGTGTVILTEDYETDTIGTNPCAWSEPNEVFTTVDGSSIFSSPHCLQLDQSASPYTGAGRPDAWTASTNIVEITWKAAVDQTNARLSFTINEAGGTAITTPIYFSETGNILLDDAGVLVNGYSAGTVYTFKVVADATADTFDIYVNDMNTAIYSNHPFDGTTTSVPGRMYFGGSTVHVGKMWVDDIQVKEL